MKIPLKEVLASGDWLLLDKLDMDFKFKIRLLSFTKANPKNIDDYDKLNFITDAGSIWMLKFELINVSKTQMPCHAPQLLLLLVDQDDCNFECITDYALTSREYGKKTGLIRFNYSEKQLSPKIKATGALAYLLPDDEEAEYFISTKDGRIQGA